MNQILTFPAQPRPRARVAAIPDVEPGRSRALLDGDDLPTERLREHLFDQIVLGKLEPADDGGMLSPSG